MKVFFRVNEFVFVVDDVFKPFVRAVAKKFGDAGVDPDLLKDVIGLLQDFDGSQPVTPAVSLKLREYATYFAALAMAKNVRKAEFQLTDDIQIDVR